MAKQKKQQPPASKNTLSIRLPSDLMAVVEELAKEERRTATQMGRLLIEDGLVARGRWQASIEAK